MYSIVSGPCLNELFVTPVIPQQESIIGIFKNVSSYDESETPMHRD